MKNIGVENAQTLRLKYWTFNKDIKYSLILRLKDDKRETNSLKKEL